MPYIKGERRTAIIEWLNCVDDHVEGDVQTPMTALFEAMPKDCGELNFALTMTCIAHNRVSFGSLDRKLNTIGKAYLLGQPLRYQRINDLIGACHGAAMELERRRPGAKKFEAISLIAVARSLYSELGVGYEETKIAENGDIDYGESADAEMIRNKGNSK